MLYGEKSKRERTWSVGKQDKNGASGIPPSLSSFGKDWGKELKHLQLVQENVLNVLYS